MGPLLIKPHGTESSLPLGFPQSAHAAGWSQGLRSSPEVFMDR